MADLSDPLDRGPASDLIAATIRRDGPLPFERFVHLALYAPEVGFYEAGGAAGRAGGDFLTSPEVGPLFGAVVARALDAWWDELGRPDPFTVVDAGAGPGALALAVRAASPRCAPALHYVLVERSRPQRDRHADHLELVPAPNGSSAGPWFTSVEEVPDGPLTGVVLANELLDNLSFGIVARQAGEWHQVAVDLAGDGRLVEVLEPASPAVARVADELVPRAGDGTRFPLQRTATAWLGEVLDRVERGRVVVLDYGAPTAELASRGRGWLRTFRGHQRGGPPLERPGSQDITSDVATDQLGRLRPPDHDRTQEAFLRAHGLDDLVEEGRRVWRERAHLGDLEALQARSRVSEAEALTDPDGLGAFRVLEWIVAPPTR